MKRIVAIIAAGFFTLFIAYGIRYGYGMLLPEMLSALNISKAEAGVIYASYFLTYTIFSPIVGVLSDRYDVRLILACFTALLAAGSFLMAYATTALSASIFFTLAGIGHAACWGPVVAMVQKWVPDHRRGAALAVTTMGSQSGIACWSLLLPLIIGRYNWQAGWISMGCFGFCVAGLNLLLIRNPPGVADSSQSGAPRGVFSAGGEISCWQLLRAQKLWLIGLSYLFVGFAVLVPTTFLCAYATEQLHLSYAVATGFITVIAISGIVGKLILGIYSDQWGRIPVMMLCGVLMGVGCWGMAATKALSGIYACCGLYGLGFGAVWPVYAAAAPDYFDKAAAGSVIGLWTVFMGIGSMLSPVVCGWAIDTTGAYVWTFNAGMIASVLSAIFLLPALRSPRPVSSVALN
jgi:MFS family permease